MRVEQPSTLFFMVIIHFNDIVNTLAKGLDELIDNRTFVE